MGGGDKNGSLFTLIHGIEGGGNFACSFPIQSENNQN